MENKTESQPTKAGRYRYFQMLIHLGLTGPKINLRIDSLPLIQVLKANQFVSQLVLEITLDQLTIEDHGRLIYLSNFSGQLQRDDPSGVPYFISSLFQPLPSFLFNPFKIFIFNFIFNPLKVIFKVVVLTS